MPTIEFHGFSSEDSLILVEWARDALGDLPFRGDVVFEIPASGTRVLGWESAERPFLRVLTRVGERGAIIAQRLGRFADIEVAPLDGFTPQTGTDASHEIVDNGSMTSGT